MFKPAANIRGCLTADATALANVLSVDATTWAYLSALLAPGDWTFIRLGVAPTCEIVRVDSAIGAYLQVTRGFDGTSPTAYPSGTEFEYVLCEQAVIDIIQNNPLAAPVVTLLGIPPVTVTQVSTNSFEISVDTLALTSDGSIDVLGTYPDIQIAVNKSTNGCCE